MLFVTNYKLVVLINNFKHYVNYKNYNYYTFVLSTFNYFYKSTCFLDV